MIVLAAFPLVDFEVTIRIKSRELSDIGEELAAEEEEERGGRIWRDARPSNRIHHNPSSNPSDSHPTTTHLGYPVRVLPPRATVLGKRCSP